MDAQVLQGVNQPIQTGYDIPQDTSSPVQTQDNPETFWQKLGNYYSGVSGFNFYKNLFNDIFNNKGYWDSMMDGNGDFMDFWTYMFGDMSKDKNQQRINDFSGKGQVADYVSDLLGVDSASGNGDPYDDLPSYLSDVFRQGLDIFNENVNKQYEYNALEAQKAREWEEMMSNTAYQRAMADLKKAGINPLLAFSSGMSPASTPSSASASGTLGNSNNLFSSMASSILGDKKILTSLLIALSGLFKVFTAK